MANVLMRRIPKKRPKVKPQKPKPRIKRKRAKKKKPLTKAQRSRAAKRGWKKRKAKEREFRKKVKVARGKNIAPLPALVRLQSDIFEQGIMFAIQRLKPEDQEAALQDIIADYVANSDMEDDDETKIRARLMIADAEGNLEEVMGIISQEYNMPLSEVYTEWIYCGTAK